MFIVSLEYSGTWLELPDKDKAFEIQNHLSSMETALTDMAIALTMFDESQLRSHEEHTFGNTKDSWERDSHLRRQIEDEYRSGLSSPTEYYTNHDVHRIETEKRFRQAKLDSGEIPRSYKHRFSFIHAHSFLSAADTFANFLTVIAEETSLQHVNQILAEFEANFPTLTKVRNSAQHVEDRSRGYGKPADVRKKVKMDLKPIDNSFIKAEGGVLALSNLNGNKLGYTIDDGTYQEFEISQNTLSKIAGLFQRLINGFQWKGPAHIEPYI